MYDAIYSRQSVEKADSISIESQIEHCKYETRGNKFKEYADRGYSGKNTNRPAFEEMLSDIKQGKVSRVIVYKLDRISRSILDFTSMMEMFQQHDVEFVSSTEKFDTSTPIGRAMLNICIVFAQLERETIQKRVTDSYHSRSKRGFFMGGNIPYGYKLTDTVIDGIKTSMYTPVPEEIEQVKLIYSLYSNPANSLGRVLSYLNEHGIKRLRKGAWNTSRISETLRNPSYVQADADVYEFFRSQGANINNPVSDFNGSNACYLYQGTSTTTFSNLNGKEIVIAPHQGVISSDEWLKCRFRCLSNKSCVKPVITKSSWLTGKAKCGKCGYSLSAVYNNTKEYRYFICSRKLITKNGECQGTGGTIHSYTFEDYMYKAIKNRLSEFTALCTDNKNTTNPKINELKIRISQIDNEVNELLTKVVGATPVLMKYINEKVDILDAERKQLQEDILSLSHTKNDRNMKTISNHVSRWDDISFEDRQAVVNALIKVIHVSDGNIDISWNI